MPESQQVVSDQLGTTWFVIIIIIFWLVTLIVANILDRLFTWLRDFRAAGNSLWDAAWGPARRFRNRQHRRRLLEEDDE